MWHKITVSITWGKAVPLEQGLDMIYEGSSWCIVGYPQVPQLQKVLSFLCVLCKPWHRLLFGLSRNQPSTSLQNNAIGILINKYWSLKARSKQRMWMEWVSNFAISSQNIFTRICIQTHMLAKNFSSLLRQNVFHS